MSSTPDSATAPQTAPQTAPADADNLVVIARQAILDDKRAVFGYELFDRITAANCHTAASDAAMLFNALCYAGSEALGGKKTVFINCTHESLAGGHLELIHPEKVVLEVPTFGADATPEQIAQLIPTMQALRTRGFRLAFNQEVLRRAYASWLPLASFIKLDMQAIKPELAEPLVKYVQANCQATLVAEKVETAEQHERMAALGVKLFQGYWFAHPSTVKAQTIRRESGFTPQ